VAAEGRLAGRTVLVTGGARRIGAAVCRALAAEGARVAVHYRHSEREALELGRELGGGSYPVKGELSTREGCERTWREALAWTGRIDGVVCNAGIFLDDGAEEAALAEMEAVNGESPGWLLGLLAGQGGGGMSAVAVTDCRVARPEGEDGRFRRYASGKRRVAASVERWARELAGRVRVNAVAPGPVLVPEGVREAAGELPLGRRPTANDVAEAVAFLCGAEAVSGVTIWVDGGRRWAGGALGQGGREGSGR
jgi:NAD(P)-dependent dehydrogenase (short-subunit alcohol dehydrogenase family)